MAELTPALLRASYTAEGVAAHLGPDATEALYRGEPGVVYEASSDDSRLSFLIRFFLLRVPASCEELAHALSSRLALTLLDAHVITRLPSGEVHVALDIRPHIIAGENRIIVSDLDASTTEVVPGPDHVLGVGAASLSLLSATPCSPVESVLDLGTGSGVQAVAQSASAVKVVATDVSSRALAYARATLAANALSNVDLRQGPWFEPVEGELFDRIVANPPFVVGPPEVGHVYRDSGLALDGATELIAGEAPRHLSPDGTAYVLGSWVHTVDGSWQNRVASWLPPTGVSAWVLQRDVADPALYVSTWLRDESIDPRSPRGVSLTRRRLNYLTEEGVTAIGFGWIFLRDIGDAPSEVTAEELTHPFSDPLGPEVEEYFVRAAWLRESSSADVLASRFLVRPGVAVEQVESADVETGMGFAPRVIRLARTDGPRFSHEIDDGLLSIVSGLHPRGLSLQDVAGLWATAHAVAETDKFYSDVARAVVDLVRHGVLIPADIAEIVR
ncbi:DUF7059 domain-containing protein [Corynebacterium capitovis]|uniref:DUF7782 domain-containing protein n=1 Tax=Corynebacterium capitovis TaxID=131081 RepID=UPI00068882E7|nr:class I SAM-dependent methyltransferase [Corynebacterium capitovis]